MSDNSEDSLVLVDEQNMYQVEQIKDKVNVCLDQRIMHGETQYLVKWLHWDKPQDMTWEPARNLETVSELIQMFEQSRKKTSSLPKKPQSKKHHESPPAKKVESKQKHLVKVSDKNRELEKEQKRKAKQTRRKQQKTIMVSESEEEQQQQKTYRSKREAESSSRSYGHINHIFVNSRNEPMYEVDVLNRQGKCIGVQALKNQEIQAEQLQSKVVDFLENYLLDDHRWKGLS